MMEFAGMSGSEMWSVLGHCPVASMNGTIATSPLLRLHKHHNQHQHQQQQQQQQQRQHGRMGDPSARTGGHTPSAKPRPLGQVKTESLHFHSVGSRQLTFIPGYAGLQELCEGEDYGFRLSVRSMRELRESLRHAALLNIVAAANTDHTQAEGPPAPVEQHRLLQHHHQQQQQLQPPTGTGPTSQHLYSSMPHHHHHYHQQQGQQRVASPLALQVTSSRSSPFEGGVGGGGGGGGGGRSAGSSNFHPTNGSSPGGATSPQTLVANLLSPRMRTISIPRPRAHGLPGPFINRSVAQAKENLSMVGDMVRTRAEGEEAGGRSGAVSALPVETKPSQYDGSWKAGLMGSGPGMMLPLRGHSLDPKHGQQQEKSGDTTIAKQTSADQSRDTSATTSASTNPHSASLTSERSAANTDTPPSASTGVKKSGGKMKEDPRQQMLSVRRHLTPSKKRELVKRLTEIAKCEAVDMTDPMANDDDTDLRFVSPMIIMSQQRYEIRHPEDSLPVASHTPTLTGGEPSTTRPTPNGLTVTSTTINGGASAGRNSLLHRTKSLTSLTSIAGYPSAARSKKTSSGVASVGNEPMTLDHAQSVPDLLAQDGDGNITDQQDDDQPDNIDWTAESLFTDGIIGRTIRRGIEGLRNSHMESRPLLPATPNLRLRRGTRPTGRRSALGLRDRGPSDTPAPGLITNSEASDAPPDPNALPELSIPYTQILPTLTITGLSARDKPGASPANSRAAGELRPMSQLNMLSSQKLFQQLDDQCEKLQRQLNITLNVPRRGSQWQHGSTPATLPMSRSDVSAHLQCVALSDGSSPTLGRTGVKDTATSRGRRSQNVIAHGNHTVISDVDEHSVVWAGGDVVGDRPERAGHRHSEARDEDTYERESEVPARQGQVTPSHFTNNDEHPPLNRKTSYSSRHSISSSVDGPSLRVNLDGVPDADPVLQSGVKEPRYQGFSSRVGENEGRSQFHYVNTSRPDTEEEREMKYRVLKALDQDVYYDFQHRKYRSNTATPVAKCNNEEDRPRVHFYKVKVNGNS